MWKVFPELNHPYRATVLRYLTISLCPVIFDHRHKHFKRYDNGIKRVSEFVSSRCESHGFQWRQVLLLLKLYPVGHVADGGENDLARAYHYYLGKDLELFFFKFFYWRVNIYTWSLNRHFEFEIDAIEGVRLVVSVSSLIFIFIVILVSLWIYILVNRTWSFDALMPELYVFPETLVWRLVWIWSRQLTARLLPLQIRALLRYSVLQCLYYALFLPLDQI